MKCYKVEIEFHKKDIILAARVLMLYGYDIKYFQIPNGPSVIVVDFPKLMGEKEWSKAYNQLENLVARYNFASIMALVDS